jgi:hypothetical protein
MARPPSWLPRLAEIRRSVVNSKRTHYDRPALEQLFQMQPRAAGKLMKILPQVDALGRSRLVERGALARFLDAINDAEDATAAYSEQRTQGAKISRKKPRLLVRKELISEGRLDNLPATTKLERGRLKVDFNSKMELLETLAIFLGAVENDEDEFIERFVLAPPGSAERERARQEVRDARILFEELRQMEANRDKKMN